jgi:hypothetical protein
MSSESGAPVDLRAWVEAWSTLYPAHHDDVIGKFEGATSFDVDDLEEIVDWKFGSMSHRRANAKRGLAREADRVAPYTRRALACNDDLGALLILCEFHAVGPAMASTILMFAKPQRYTVMDTRAIKSLRALDVFHARYTDAMAYDWPGYEEACRGIADKTQLDLRTVDRALYQANGNADLPGLS